MKGAPDGVFHDLDDARLLGFASILTVLAATLVPLGLV
jgi:hypothetical protein